MSLDTAYQTFDAAIDEARDWFTNEIASLRTGRVTTKLIEAIPIEHYGSRTPLNGLAGLSSSDARTIVISPWDASAIAAIEKALTDAQLGANPTVDGKVIRLSFPQLNEETREETIKVLHRHAEEARVRLRKGRDEALSKIKAEKTKGDLTEDDFYQGREELDKRIDQANQTIDDIVKDKEEAIRQI